MHTPIFDYEAKPARDPNAATWFEYTVCFGGFGLFALVTYLLQ